MASVGEDFPVSRPRAHLLETRPTSAVGHLDRKLGATECRSPQTGPWVFDEKETSSQIGLCPDQQQSRTLPAGPRMDIATNMQLKPKQI